MSTRVDPKITQSENLKKLLENNGVTRSKIEKIKTWSVTPENKTVNEKQHNTKLSIVLTETPEEPITTAYTRVKPGWVGDDSYVFTYDNMVGTPLKKDNSEEDLTTLTKMINTSAYFSQDEKYPFRVSVNQDYTRIEVIPHLDSPCYVGNKEFGLKIITDPRSVKIFEPVTYLISAMGIPDSKWVNNDKKESITLELQTPEGESKTVKALVVPYKQQINGVMYKMNLGTIGDVKKAHLLYTDDAKPVPKEGYESIQYLGQPLGGDTLSENQIESLKLLYADTAEEGVVTYSNAKLSNDSISDNNLLSIKHGVHDYGFNVLKTKVQDIYFNLLESAEEGDIIRSIPDSDNYVLTTDATYRSRFPEEMIFFTATTSNTENILTLELKNIPDYSKVTGTRTALGNFSDFERLNQFLRLLRQYMVDKLKKRGMSVADISVLLQSYRFNNAWNTLTDQFTTTNPGYPDLKKESLFIDYNVTFNTNKGAPVNIIKLLSKATWNTAEKKEQLLTNPNFFNETLKTYLVDNSLIESGAEIEIVRDNTIRTTGEISLTVNRPVTPEGTTDKVVKFTVDRYGNGVVTAIIPKDGYKDYKVFQYEKIPAYELLPDERTINNVDKSVYSVEALKNANLEEFTNLMKKYLPNYPFAYIDLDKTKDAMHYLADDKEKGIGIYFFTNKNNLFSNGGNPSYALVTLNYAVAPATEVAV